MSKKISPVVTLFTVVAIAGIVAKIWKALSPGHRCPLCDKVIAASDAAAAFCPNCVRLSRL